MSTVLLLNADYTPLKVLSWQRAIVMLLEDKVNLVTAYADRAIRSTGLEHPFPAVVALKRYSQFRTKVRFNRQNVLARDAWTCQYCGAQPRRPGGRPALGSLTIDHVVPRAHAKEGVVTLPWNRRKVSVTCWENVTTACAPCNHRKADRTPGQAGMQLSRLPRYPNQWDLLWMATHWVDVPEEWSEYLPEDSPWRDYGTVELAAD